MRTRKQDVSKHKITKKKLRMGSRGHVREERGGMWRNLVLAYGKPLYNGKYLDK
jgi:hypothetical protein